MSSPVDIYDREYYREACRRSDAAMREHSKVQVQHTHRPFTTANQCLVDGRPNLVRCDWSGIRTVEDREREEKQNATRD